MRGYVQKQSSNTLYFDVKYGSICEVSKKAREGFESIKVVDVSTGEELTKHVRRYDTIEALITKIEWRDTKQQYATRFQSWEIHLLNAANEPAVLRLPLKSAAADRFMKCAENIDFSKPVEFRAWKDTRGEREKTAFYIGQRVNENDEKSVKVEQKYKQGDMGDCPEWVEELDGWNSAAQRKFLYDQMINVVIPKVEAIQASKGIHHEEEFDDDDTAPF